jgi:hypothetical protein
MDEFTYKEELIMFKDAYEVLDFLAEKSEMFALIKAEFEALKARIEVLEQNQTTNQ